MLPEPLLRALLAAPILGAAWTLYATARGIRAVDPLPHAPPEPPRWPRVSVIVPACNEEASLEAATRAKLASDYPDFELIVVDDRSSDATGAIVDRLAAADARVRAVHIARLPEGWLGKVHALHEGAAVATGEWLLFSDADAHFEPTLLRRVVAESERRGFDLVALLPSLWSNAFALDALFATLLRVLVVGGRLWKLDDPRSSVAAGAGFFNLARRSVFERTPGFPWLRLEVVDDGAFAQMMKRAGARCGLLHASDAIGLDYYRSLGEAVHGFEKNGYALLGAHRPVPAMVLCAFMIWTELGPLAFLLSEDEAVALLGGAVLAAFALSQLVIARFMRRPLASAGVPILGPLLFLYCLARSAVLAHWRGGIVWRGTLYPLASLRAGRRLRFF